MDVSVIIPIYNSEKYLNRCFDSLTRQYGVECEFICVDDGSTDNSLSICEKYYSKDKRFKILKNKHMGVSTARNCGLNVSNGTYICFLDSDDCLSKNALSKLFTIIKNNSCDSIIYGAKLKKGKKWMYESLPKHNKLIEEFNTEDIFHLKECRPFVWTHFIKKEIIRNIRFNETLRLGEDQEFIIKYLSKVRKVMFIRTKMCIHYNYPKSSFNKISSDPNIICENHIKMVSAVISEIKLNTPEFAEWVFDTLYTCYIKSQRTTDNKERILHIFEETSIKENLCNKDKLMKYNKMCNGIPKN